MRPRTLLILALVVLGLGSFIWFYERRLPGSEKRVELAKKVFPDLEKDEISALVIRAEEGTVRLEKEEKEKEEKDSKDDQDDDEDDEAKMEETAVWRITEPFSARADSLAVDRLLSTLTALEQTRTLEEADPKALGLDKPRASVRLVTGKGDRVLLLGAQVPTGAALIAGLEGAPTAWVVSDAILAELNRKPGDWRDRTMVYGDRDAVEEVRLAGASGPVRLKARKDGFWIESPLVDRADRDLVQGFLSDLFGLSAESFIDEPGETPESLGLAPPARTVVVKLKGQPSPIVVELGNAGAMSTAAAPSPPESESATPLLPARVGAQIFETRTRLAEAADRAAADWRALGWSAFEVHQIESATVKDAAGDFQLSRADPDWRRDKVKISYLPVSDLLFSVTGARAGRLLAPEAIELGPPEITLTLASKDAGTETLTLFPATAEGVPARASGRGVVLLLSQEILGEVKDRIRQVREAKPAEEAKSE
jgi:hypothetical protein